MAICGDSQKFEFFRGKNLKNPQSWTYPRPRNFPETILGIFGDKTPKKLKIEPTLVPEKSPKVFRTLSPSPPHPRNSGMGTGKIGDWGPVPPPYYIRRIVITYYITVWLFILILLTLLECSRAHDALRPLTECSGSYVLWFPVCWSCLTEL